MALVSFVDETTSGERHDAWGLEIFEERLSLRELIRRRVFQEVAEFNARQPELFNGLVQPTGAERALNGFRVRKGSKVDAETQFTKAVDAFNGNGFVVLVADRQVEELDDEIELARNVEVTFLKLVPLVGG